MMKIIFYAYPKVYGGLMRHIDLLAEGLSERHEATFILPEEFKESARFHSQKESTGSSSLKEDRGFPGSKELRTEQCVVKGKYDWSGFFRLYHYLKSAGADVFHVHLASPGESTLAFLAAVLAGVPAIVATEHSPAWFPLGKFYSRAVKRFCARFIDRVIALSESGRLYLHQAYGIEPEKMAVVYNGVKIPDRTSREERVATKRRWKIDETSTVITSISEITERKGIGVLLQAADELIRQEKKVHFLLIGEGVLRAEFERRYKSHIDSGHLAFPGYLRDIRPCLSISDLFVLPSLGEEFPVSLLEAMAAGVPVIATDVGGIPEMIKHLENGWLVKPGDAEELRSALLRLMNDRDLARTLAGNALELVRSEFSAAGMVRQTEAIYSSLLEKKRGSEIQG